MITNLESRALAAYYRSGRPTQRLTAQEAMHQGKGYVAILDFKEVIAVYRVKNDGFLKALRRWPKDLFAK